MDWFRGERLGHGSFAQVNLAAPRSRSSFLPPLMAVKSCGVSLSSSLLTEKNILEELRDCPEIIRCYGGSYSCENGEKLYNVLLEYASGGSLADKLKFSGDRRLPEVEVRQYTKAILKGLHYIHKFGYVHCDIKLQNILLCADGSVKIADFGLAKRADGGAAGCELRGTPMYMSPEMVAGSKQGAPADVWALGCVVAEMVSGSPAWSCSDVAALLMRIGVGEEVPEIPGFLTAEGKDFLEKCFVKDPRQRWTAEMLLDHPFVCGEEMDGRDSLKENTASISPRCPFDFQDWSSCSITSLPSPSESNSAGWSVSTAAERLRELLVNFTENSPNWSVSDDWVTIR
ncbi:mitogen-activated protein kinase kinase kinase 21 [Perilla frutescens var. hirtella]|uniref:Mitogen-activated protein kinase kinase kinase 21 n=1 Tax=Perilla frutescens var. hirtella TaxID=608512 RepID=A0AAD4JQC0_PERFH|nr:mitogen-activated protein kinase kinase kinase 21 [Perilla frutescens var. hirtella]